MSAFNCELSYFPSPHLNQIYEGFEKLRKIGLVNLSVKRSSGRPVKPLLKVLLNNKIRIVYDTLDGLNWINGTTEENLNYFKKTVEADYYFKRSFNQHIIDHAPENCKVFPLGLNYNMKTDSCYYNNVKRRIKNLLKNNFMSAKYHSKPSFYSNDFEYFSRPSSESKILFMARLWNPDEVLLDHLKLEREQINQKRIDVIRSCKEEYGDRFIGGLRYDKFSLRHAKDLILPYNLTKKENFLKNIRGSNICIATTGLHNSIGWKFGEYIAASRAIVSEPLNYRLPGDFKIGKNYSQFNNNSELLNCILDLINDQSKLTDMMKRNHTYYNNHLRPDKLVLNTLLQVKPI